MNLKDGKMVFKNFLSKSKDIDILANLPDGVIVIDGEGKVQWLNEFAANMFEVEKGENSKHSVNELLEGGFDLVKQAALSGRSVVGRLNNLSKEMFIEITGKYAEDCIIASLRDVTQNYKTVTNILSEHETSKKSSNDKNIFIVKLANELKSPLHSVVGFSQAMMDGLGGEVSEKQEKYIKIINKNSNELLYLMDKIIEFSRIEANLLEDDFQIFDGINTIQNVMKNNEATLLEKNLTFNFNSEEIVKRTIFSDEGHLKTIMQNVLETAIKSTDIGSITVKVSHPELESLSTRPIIVPESATDKSYLKITVSDTGAGYAESDLNLLFEPYVQLEKPNKKNINKSIALTSAKKLVKYLRGDIWVESSPMQGTVYNIILPIEKFV